jgi:hypothetical protein
VTNSGAKAPVPGEGVDERDLYRMTAHDSVSGEIPESGFGRARVATDPPVGDALCRIGREGVRREVPDDGDAHGVLLEETSDGVHSIIGAPDPARNYPARKALHSGLRKTHNECQSLYRHAVSRVAQEAIEARPRRSRPEERCPR